MSLLIRHALTSNPPTFLTVCVAFVVVSWVSPGVVGGVPQDVAAATGVVYVDANQNQMRDAGEMPLPDVRVSNGREVAVTDAHGQYLLPVDEDTIVFVIKPAGYRTVQDEDHLSRFYYIHKPNGSPKLDFPGVDPTGPLPATIDFALYPSEEPSVFDVIFFGDPQPRDQKEIDYIAHDVVEDLVGAKAALERGLGWRTNRGGSFAVRRFYISCPRTKQYGH